MLAECKVVRLYAEMSKFKQIKEEMFAFDKLPEKEQNDQKDYDNLLKILDREAQRETRKVVANRAMKPLDNVMANITNTSPKGGANYFGAPTDGGKDGGKNSKGKGKGDPAGKGGNDKNSENNQNATWNDGKGDPAQTPKGKEKGDKGCKKGHNKGDGKPPKGKGDGKDNQKGKGSDGGKAADGGKPARERKLKGCVTSTLGVVTMEDPHVLTTRKRASSLTSTYRLRTTGSGRHLLRRLETNMLQTMRRALRTARSRKRSRVLGEWQTQQSLSQVITAATILHYPNQKPLLPCCGGRCGSHYYH